MLLLWRGIDLFLVQICSVDVVFKFIASTPVTFDDDDQALYITTIEMACAHLTNDSLLGGFLHNYTKKRLRMQSIREPRCRTRLKSNAGPPLAMGQGTTRPRQCFSEL